MPDGRDEGRSGDSSPSLTRRRFRAGEGAGSKLARDRRTGPAASRAGSPARIGALLLVISLAPLGFLLARPAAAQSPSPYEPVRRDPLGTRLIDVATPYTVGGRTVELLFTHRFQQTIQEGDAHDLWGLDGGADVGLGVTVGATPHLDLSLFRSSFQENFELSGKFLVLEQAPRVPLSLALRAGLDRLERKGVEDPSRPFGQLLLARRFLPGLTVLAAPSWVRDTPRLRNAVNVPLGIAVGLPGGSLLEVEVVPENRDLDRSTTAWHAALSKSVGGHIFELVAGNSRAVTVDQFLGGDSAAPFERGDVRLGFNLVRDFHY